MSDTDFAPLPRLTFVERLAGSETLARYEREDGARVIVERRPREGTPRSPGAFVLNDRAEVVVPVSAVHEAEAATYVVYAGDALCALPARVNDRRWSEEERLSCLEQVARGLRALHEAGRVHGDLTPDAVVLLASGEARFLAIAPAAAPSAQMSAKPGEARTFGPTLNRIRATGGALAYLAPEQFMASSTLPESDVFAWGCLAYELATGRPPFGFLTDPTKLLEAITRGPQRAVHDLSPRFAPAFDAIVRGTLAVERTKRVLPLELPGDLVTAGATPKSASPPSAKRAGPSWALPALMALAACAAVAYFASGR